MVAEVALTLAGTVVSQLLIPFIKKGAETLKNELFDGLGKKMAETAAETAAKGAVDVAQKAWDRVKGAMTGDHEKAAVTVFESDPETAAPILTKALAAKIQSDETLRKDLQALVDEKINGTQSTTATIFGDYGTIQQIGSVTVTGGTQQNIGSVHNTYGGSPAKPADDSSDPSKPKG
jgi:hypothetical protein